MEDQRSLNSLIWERLTLKSKYSFEIGFQIVSLKGELLCFNKLSENKNEYEINQYSIDKIDFETNDIVTIFKEKGPRYRLTKVFIQYNYS